MTYVLGTISEDVRKIGRAWSEFGVKRSPKSELLTVLVSELGYAGMIHEFKNFVLRKDMRYLEQVHHHLGAARSALVRYRSLPLTSVERAALNQIDRVIEAYGLATKVAKDMVEGGKTPGEIDRAVKVDDRPSLDGLAALDQEVARELGKEFASVSRARVLASIRAAIGMAA